MGKTIAITNLKGGGGKTMTAASLSAGLAMQGKRVLSLDADPQHSLTVSFGVPEPEKLTVSLTSAMSEIINETSNSSAPEPIRHAEGFDLLPSNSTLAGVELALAGVIGRETVLRQYIESVKPLYDYIIVDCAPTRGLLTINALAAADSVIIPVTPKFLDAKGLELLLQSIAQIRRQINKNIEISGILLTMADRRARFTREIISLVENTYGSDIRIFSEAIPHSVRAAEASASGGSIFRYDPRGKVAAAYQSLVREVLRCA